MLTFRFTATACATVACLAFAPPSPLTAVAFAQDSSGTATELFNVGRDLMKSGDFTNACPKLAESARLDAKVGTLARLAECEEQLGHRVSARARWEQAVNLAVAANDSRLAHVKSELARLDARVPKLLLSVDGAPPPGLMVHIDALEVGAASLGVPIAVETGTHHVVATATGKLAWSADVVAPKSGAVVTVAIPALADAPVVPVAAVAPVVVAAQEPAPASRGSARGTVGLVAAGVGVVGLGVGIAYGIIALHKNSQSNAQPNGCDAASVCPSAAYTLRNDARTDGTVSSVALLAGGILAAGGVVLWLTAPAHGSTSVGVTPTVGPRLAGFTLQGAF